MRKVLMTMAALLISMGSAMADEVTVSAITIPQGSSATLSISLTNSNSYRQQFQLQLSLPAGITMRAGSATLSDRFGASATLACNEVSTRVYQFICQPGTDITPISGNSGVLMSVVLDADASVVEGTTGLQGSVTDIEVTTTEITAWTPADQTFDITIGAPLAQVTLDETSTSAPEASTGAVDVTVNRSITAENWSTICLPFDMTEAQVKSAFGEDVEIEKLTSWSFTGTPAAPDYTVENITLGFTSVTAMAKNTPYLIRHHLTSDITSFDVSNVVIDPEDAPELGSVDYAVGSKTKKHYYANMFGVYAAKTGTDDSDVFIADNKFWYSNGSTAIKAFRATFWFTDASDNLIRVATGDGARIKMSFDEETTGISDVLYSSEMEDNWYSLDGCRLGAEPTKKGMYIHNGKKIIIK